MRSFSSKALNSLQSVLVALHYKRRYLGEWLNIYKKKGLIKSVRLSKTEINTIQKVWKDHFGKTIPLYWHRLYASYTGQVDPLYFPEIYYSTILERKLNDFNVALSAEDKGQLDIVLHDPLTNQSNTVPSYIIRVSGVYYDNQRNMIDQNMALNTLRNIGKCVIKPTNDTDSGRGVRVLNLKEGVDTKTSEIIESILCSYTQDIIVQEYIHAHELIKALNPSSVNTIRIITYRCNGGIFHTPLAMRIGANNAEVDNIHAGGFVIGLDDEGNLNKYAFTEYGEKVAIHPMSNIEFGSYVIPGVQAAISMAERKHALFPRLTFISWDFTILDNGEPIIIEMNTRNQSAWFPQMVNGKSLFGDNTVFMINLLKQLK